MQSSYVPLGIHSADVQRSQVRLANSQSPQSLNYMFGIPSADAKVAVMADIMLIAVGGSSIEGSNKRSPAHNGGWVPLGNCWHSSQGNLL